MSQHEGTWLMKAVPTMQGMPVTLIQSLKDMPVTLIQSFKDMPVALIL